MFSYLILLAVVVAAILCCLYTNSAHMLLNNVTMQLCNLFPGSFPGLSGESLAGETTLLQLLAHTYYAVAFVAHNHLIIYSVLCPHGNISGNDVLAMSGITMQVG